MKLAAVAIHPAPYRDHVFERLAARPGISFRAFYPPDAPPWRVAAPRYPVERFESVPSRVFRNSYMLRYLGGAIFGALSRFKPDAVLCYGYDCWPMQGAILRAFAEGVPVLLRNDANHMARPDWRKALRRRAAGIAFRAFGVRALAIGAANADYWEREMRFPASRVHWAPYTVDNDFFNRESSVARKERRDAMRRGWGAEGKHVFLFVGRLVPEKDAALLLAAYARLSARRENTGLVIVGRGPERARLERLVRDGNIPGVVFAGFVEPENLPAYYAASDTFVLPSRWEPWGLVVNEAMASGLGVVVSDAVGAWPDLVHEGVNGFVFPSGDEAALAGALDNAASALPGEMGKLSRDIVTSRHGVEIEIEGILGALRAFERGRA